MRDDNEMAKIARVQKRFDAQHRAPEAIVVPASDITPRPLDPVWDGVLWAGKPTLLAGDPGLGKSMLTADIAARVTTGKPWPCATAQRAPADVVMLSAEDDPADTLVPRLMAAGADLKRVSFVHGVIEPHDEGPRKVWLSLDRHIRQLADVLLERSGRVRLLVVDPLSAYLGRDCDSHNEGDVRTILSGLAELAAEHRCAVLAVRHLRKSESVSAQSKIIGSVAFTAAARAVYVVARDPEDEDRRLVLCAKNNLAPDTAGYSYCINVNDDKVPYVAWGDKRETRTADEVLGSAVDRKSAVDDAEVWIRRTLAAAPVASKLMPGLARKAGHSWRTIERARDQMGGDLIIERDVIAGHGNTGPWQWRLATPQPPTPPPPATNSGGLGGDRSAIGFDGRSDRHTATPPYIGTGGGVDSASTPCPDCYGSRIVNGRPCDMCGEWKAADGTQL